MWKAEGLEPPTDQKSKLQKAWDLPHVSVKFNTLLTSAIDERDRARLLAAQSPHSGAWLQALPMSSVGLRMTDDTIRIAAGLRLGAALCQPHICICGAKVDKTGAHGLSCRQSAGRHPRHGELNEIICKALTSSNFAARREPNNIIRNDGKRPDGATMIPWKHGRCLVWDATVPDTIAPSHVSASARLAGSAAIKAEAQKTRKYSNITADFTFVPIAIETLGSYGQEARRLVQMIGQRLKSSTGDHLALSHLRQRIAIAIQRGNAAAVMGSLPEVRKSVLEN